MKRLILCLAICLFCLEKGNTSQASLGEIYLGSREGDPASLVENVSIIHGDYAEVEVDLVASAPDSLVLSRLYSSLDNLNLVKITFKPKLILWR